MPKDKNTYEEQAIKKLQAVVTMRSSDVSAVRIILLEYRQQLKQLWKAMDDL